jgi:hypothetical protein
MKTYYFLFISIIVCTSFLTSCKTTTTLSNKVSLGMTKEQVIANCGNPYKKSAKYDKEQNLQEILFYKEKTWDDGGWSWSTTVTNHIFVFKNNKLVAIEQGDEEHNKQSYNTMFMF